MNGPSVLEILPTWLRWLYFEHKIFYLGSQIQWWKWHQRGWATVISSKSGFWLKARATWVPSATWMSSPCTESVGKTIIVVVFKRGVSIGFPMLESKRWNLSFEKRLVWIMTWPWSLSWGWTKPSWEMVVVPYMKFIKVIFPESVALIDLPSRKVNWNVGSGRLRPGFQISCPTFFWHKLSHLSWSLHWQQFVDIKTDIWDDPPVKIMLNTIHPLAWHTLEQWGLSQK